MHTHIYIYTYIHIHIQQQNIITAPSIIMYHKHPTLQSHPSSQQTIINSLHDTFNCQQRHSKQKLIDFDTIDLHNNKKPNQYNQYHTNYAINSSNVVNTCSSNCCCLGCRDLGGDGKEQGKGRDKGKSSVFKVNTSTYSVSRTSGCIAKRLEDACRRLQYVQTSISASKKNKEPLSKSIKKCNCTHLKAGSSQHPEQQQQQQQDVSYFQLMKQQSNKIEQLNKQIQKLQQNLQKKDKELIRKQEKYLKQENKLIVQINRLKKLLEQKQEKDDCYYKEKVEMDRVVDQYQVTIWDLKQKIQASLQNQKYCNNRLNEIQKIIKMHEARIDKDDLSGKSANKLGRRQHELIQKLKQAVQSQIQTDDNKQNMSQLSNRGNKSKKSTLFKNEQNGTQTYRSISTLKQKQKQKSRSYLYDSQPQGSHTNERSMNKNGWKTIEKQYIIMEQQSELKCTDKIRAKLGEGGDGGEDVVWELRGLANRQVQNQDLYRCMFLQAAMIEQFIS